MFKKWYLCFVKFIRRIIMGKEINLSLDSTLDGSERVRGIDENGRSVNFSIITLRDFFKRSQSFAIYDGAEDGIPFHETFNFGSGQDIRLGFSGSRTEESLFPAEYGSILKNIESAPAASVFDFRLLPLGFFMSFDVEFTCYMTEQNGDPQTPYKNYSVDVELTYPNGETEIKTVNAYSTYTNLDPIDQVWKTKAKLTFSTYIKDLLTDALIGGKIRVLENGLADGSPYIINVDDLIVRVKI